MAAATRDEKNKQGVCIALRCVWCSAVVVGWRSEVTVLVDGIWLRGRWGEDDWWPAELQALSALASNWLTGSTVNSSLTAPSAATGTEMGSTSTEIEVRQCLSHIRWQQVNYDDQ